jgi:DNA-binding transcriptional ArsR family regulator
VDEAALDERLRALAHPVRRRLVVDCLDAPRTAGYLVARAELAPASVSEHLKVLRKTGLLVLDRDGRFRRYRTDPAVVRATSHALAALVEAEAAAEAAHGGEREPSAQEEPEPPQEEPEPPGGRVGRPASGC